MKLFHAILANTTLATLTNMFVWFAVTFWAYLQTESVVVTSTMAGIYFATVALIGFFLGSVVDRFPKKAAMMGSSLASLAFYGIAWAIYALSPASAFERASSVALWAFITLTLLGAIAGNLRSIALSTMVTILVPEEERDKANGLVGTASGVAFSLCSVFSGLVIGTLGMGWMLAIAVVATGLVIAHLLTLSIPDGEKPEGEDGAHKIDLRGTIQAVKAVPGLFGLIFFTTFNNFLGGVFMALMDAYGLALVSVKVWGFIWGFLSLGMILGGIYVVKKGLGSRPLRTLFLTNVVMWIIASLFTIQSSIVLLIVGMFIYLCLIPVVEAVEQTILQRVIPLERQGRVFGFAQSVEQAASPLTAFLVGPLAEAVFIPFMTTGRGADLIGGWFGTGKERGIALLFTVTGIVGLIVTLLAMKTRAYRQLSDSYKDAPSEGELATA